MIYNKMQDGVWKSVDVPAEYDLKPVIHMIQQQPMMSKIYISCSIFVSGKEQQ